MTCFVLDFNSKLQEELFQVHDIHQQTDMRFVIRKHFLPGDHYMYGKIRNSEFNKKNSAGPGGVFSKGEFFKKYQ